MAKFFNIASIRKEVVKGFRYIWIPTHKASYFLPDNFRTICYRTGSCVQIKFIDVSTKPDNANNYYMVSTISTNPLNPQITSNTISSPTSGSIVVNLPPTVPIITSWTTGDAECASSRYLSNCVVFSPFIGTDVIRFTGGNSSSIPNRDRC